MARGGRKISKRGGRKISKRGSDEGPYEVKKAGREVCIIYCRVSSFGQAGVNSVSLEAQEAGAKKLARSRGYRIKQVCKEVKSAYGSSMRSLSGILSENRNTVVMFHDVSRFCRSVVDGMRMLRLALSRGNTLVFVADGMTISVKNQEHIEGFTRLLKSAELESRRTGERIRTTIKYLRGRGKYSGGYVAYGCRVVKSSNSELNNTICDDPMEKQIIDFIALCKRGEVSSDGLNVAMMKISPLVPYVKIKCYDIDRVTELGTISRALNNAEIADLLNEYRVKKRGKLWSSHTVASVGLGLEEGVGGGGSLSGARLKIRRI